MKFSLMRPGDLLTSRCWGTPLFLLTATKGKTMSWVCLDTGKPKNTFWSQEHDEVEPEYIVVRGSEELP